MSIKDELRVIAITLIIIAAIIGLVWLISLYPNQCGITILCVIIFIFIWLNVRRLYKSDDTDDIDDTDI